MKFQIGDIFKDTKQIEQTVLAEIRKKGGKVIENWDNRCVVLNVTSNSVELSHKAHTTEGVDCSQWYSVAEGNSLKDFEKRFVKI